MLDTTFPVMLPELAELRMNKQDFCKYFNTNSRSIVLDVTVLESCDDAERKENKAGHESGRESTANQLANVKSSPFMDGLLADKSAVPTLDRSDGKMLTENSDVAFRASGEPLVDLFFELEEVVAGDRLRHVLESAWKDDSDATLKIIWNARSIHLGKSSRTAFYRAVGWLAENHPVTLLINLPWLVRPLIPKKAPRKDQKNDEGQDSMMDGNDHDIQADDSDFEMLEMEPTGDDQPFKLDDKPDLKIVKLDEESGLSEYDVKYGVAHGYWKDLLNILALAANDQLKVDGNPRSVLNVEKPNKKSRKRDWTPGRKKAEILKRHRHVIKKLEDPFYKALHVSVASLFAEQLRLDMARLRSGSRAERKKITPAAKWAPSHKGMHDQHTFIVSTIAELLFAFDDVCPAIDSANRELYLKHARQSYQTRILSPLRKHLSVVERPISEKKFGEIKYERVPSLAMKQYTSLFVKKDLERFSGYIEKVASGKSCISGATLLPSTLVKEVLRGDPYNFYSLGKRAADEMIQKKLKEMKIKVIDGQWNTIVKRMKESGTLESSIAVCDVSGSMMYPTFADCTCPMDSAIGLSLLIAEITDPPFGGAFITFSASPQVNRVGGAGDKRSFAEKVRYIQNSGGWSMNTDFEAVFSKLILPMAVKNKIKPEDMVKQIFVFSDMQFDSANIRNSPYDLTETSADWRTSYQRIEQKFKDAGYPVPRLIFWNLAGGRAGYMDAPTAGDETAPKPVTAEKEGVALISGYSQGQMKIFLENGQFQAPQDELAATDANKRGEKVEQFKMKQDPISIVKLAISHEAYRMLKVVD